MESSKKMNDLVEITSSETNFKTLKSKPYYPAEIEDLFSANMILLPSFFSKNGTEGFVFPENTIEFFEYLKENSTDGLKPDIAAQDEAFNTLELHSAVIAIATVLVDYILYPVAIGLITNYLYDRLKKHHADKSEGIAKLTIIVDDGNVSKKIRYEGSVDSAKEALLCAVKEAFENDDTNE